MASNQTEEEKDDLSLPKLAGALGVGYMAYRNRNSLTRQVRKVVGKAGVTLNKAANNVQFKGKMDELKSLSNAVVDTYGDATPKNMVRNLMNSENRKEMLNKNLSAYNKGMKERLNNLSPKDVVASSETMTSAFKRNGSIARREASLINMRKTANGSNQKYKNAFGANTPDIIKIFEENPELLMRDPMKNIKMSKGKDGVFNKIDTPNINFVKAFSEYNNNAKRNIDLKVDPKDKALQKIQARIRMALSYFIAGLVPWV